MVLDGSGRVVSRIWALTWDFSLGTGWLSTGGEAFGEVERVS